MSVARECVECHRPLVPKNQAPPPGWARNAGWLHCPACYERARDAALAAGMAWPTAAVKAKGSMRGATGRDHSPDFGSFQLGPTHLVTDASGRRSIYSDGPRRVGELTSEEKKAAAVLIKGAASKADARELVRALLGEVGP